MSGTNCLGMLSREIGHNRVPAPPHMITGIIGIGIHPSRLAYSKGRQFRNCLLLISINMAR